jgi:hypothetical protein
MRENRELCTQNWSNEEGFSNRLSIINKKEYIILKKLNL